MGEQEPELALSIQDIFDVFVFLAIIIGAHRLGAGFMSTVEMVPFVIASCYLFYTLVCRCVVDLKDFD